MKSNKKSRIGYIVAPDQQAGGGMGRVKDYIIQGASIIDTETQFVPLITRNSSGVLSSFLLLLFCLLAIFWRRVTGRLAFVHANFGDKGSAVRKGLVVIFTRLIGGKVILHLHAVSLERQYDALSWPLQLLCSIPFRLATVNVVLGHRWKQWLVEKLGIKASKVAVLTNGVPLPKAADLDMNRDKSEVEILFLGNLMERKGVTDLIEAMALLDKELRFKMIFAGGGNLDLYREKVSSHGLSDRVQFAGWVNQVQAAALVRNSDLLVLPSYEEGLPLVILEALGMGTPVLCTPVGSIPEVLVHHDTAYFTPVGNASALAGSLAELIVNETLRATLSKHGRAAYEAKFSLEVFMNNLVRIYRQHGIEV